jgi:hypothetical protein
MKAIFFSLAAAAALGSSQGQLLAEDINQAILDDELFPQQQTQPAQPAKPADALGQDDTNILLHGDAAAIARKVAGELMPTGTLPSGSTLSVPWPMPASPGQQDTATTDNSLTPDEPFSD